MRLSTFSIIKNEIVFIKKHIESVLDQVDEMVFFDSSNDGTTEVIESFNSPKIKLFKYKDCSDLRDDYVRLNNECLKACTGDYVWFIHPDMIVENPERILKLKKEIDNSLRASFKITSIAGEDRDLVITTGRTDRWANIYKNDFGLHYHGWYGAEEEDLYFSAITGDEHIFYKNLPILPYKIFDSDIEVTHYCDTKPYKRRLGRMMSVLRNVLPHASEDSIRQLSIAHPRVTLQDGIWNGVEFKFKKRTTKEGSCQA